MPRLPLLADHADPERLAEQRAHRVLDPEVGGGDDVAPALAGDLLGPRTREREVESCRDRADRGLRLGRRLPHRLLLPGEAGHVPNRSPSQASMSSQAARPIAIGSELKPWGASG
jgi:hypothetical protein